MVECRSENPVIARNVWVLDRFPVREEPRLNNEEIEVRGRARCSSSECGQIDPNLFGPRAVGSDYESDLVTVVVDVVELLDVTISIEVFASSREERGDSAFCLACVPVVGGGALDFGFVLAVDPVLGRYVVVAGCRVCCH